MATGRPTKIDQVVGEVDGRPVTASERVIQAVRVGGLLDATGAPFAGVHRDTVRGWVSDATAALHKLQRDPAYTLSDYEAKAIAFSDAVGKAIADWEMAMLAILDQLARGGLERTITTEEFDGQQQLVKRVIRKEPTLPDREVIFWKLSRRFPERYSGRVELTGPEGGPVEVEHRAQALLDAIAEWESGQRRPLAPVRELN